MIEGCNKNIAKGLRLMFVTFLIMFSIKFLHIKGIHASLPTACWFRIIKSFSFWE